MSDEEAKKALITLFNFYPNATYYYKHKDIFDLFVFVILSQRTHDEDARNATQRLVSRFPSFEALAKASYAEVNSLISETTDSYKKAIFLVKSSIQIIQRFGGKVPDNMQSLLSLPGIGRKSANNILINGFGKIEGIPIDTWGIRVSYRMGISPSKNPEIIEERLMRILDRSYWGRIGYVLKAHGKSICNYNPLCEQCVIKSLCKKNLK